MKTLISGQAPAKDFCGRVLCSAVIGTAVDKTCHARPANGKSLGKTTLLVGLKNTF